MSTAPAKAPRHRINVRVAGAVGAELVAMAQRHRRSQADIVEAALASLFSPDSTDRRDAVLTRRLDRQSQQIEALQHELAVTLETLALFIRYVMSVTPSLPESQQAAARAKGAERFGAFVDTLSRRLAEGKPLLGDLHLTVRPTAEEFRSGEAGHAG